MLVQKLNTWQIFVCDPVVYMIKVSALLYPSIFGVADSATAVMYCQSSFMLVALVAYPI